MNQKQQGTEVGNAIGLAVIVATVICIGAVLLMVFLAWRGYRV